MNNQSTQNLDILGVAQSMLNGLDEICFDIETCKASEADIDAAMETWKPGKNITQPETIEKHRQEAYKRTVEKSALLDRAPIGCVAIVTKGECAIFHWIKSKKPCTEINGINASIFHVSDEREMLIQLRDWLNARSTPDTLIVGFNCIEFDLPKVRNAYVRHKLRMPDILIGMSNPVFDVMKRFLYNFSTEFSGDKYAKLSVVQNRLGLPEHKSIVSGAEVPGLIEKGEAETVLKYCFLDTQATFLAFRFMDGQYEDMPQN